MEAAASAHPVAGSAAPAARPPAPPIPGGGAVKTSSALSWLDGGFSEKQAEVPALPAPSPAAAEQPTPANEEEQQAGEEEKEGEGEGQEALMARKPEDQSEEGEAEEQGRPALHEEAAAADEEQADDVPEAEAAEATAPAPIFDPYWDEDRVREGLAKGELIRGTLRASSSRLGTAHVRPDGAKTNEQDLVIKGKRARNRAVHMDVVICKLLEAEEVPPMRGGGGKKVTAAEGDEDLEDEDEDEVELLRAPRPPAAASDSDEEVIQLGCPLVRDGPAPSRSSAAASASSAAASAPVQGGSSRPRLAKVVKIDKPKGSDRVIVCTLHANERDGQERADGIVRDTDRLLKAKPTDKRMPWILIQINDVTRRVLQIPGKLDKFQLWPVKIIGWKETSSLPLGRLQGQCLGQAGDLDAEEKHALLENGLDEHDVDFPEDLLEEVNEIVVHADRNFLEEVGRRKDLRKKRIFTIDPATARDLDDAIHVDKDEERQEVEIGVHIADVGHFLKLGSKADLEAQFRTTSVYLIGRVLPMLPHALCNHLCSLNPNEPKLAFSAYFRLKMDTGELIEDPPPWFEKTAICSACRLNYDEVQEVLDGKEIEVPTVHGGYTWEDIKADLFLLYDVCGKVRRGRFAGGALSISKQKMIFHTRDSEDGIPTGYHLEAHSASHWIIEELMLLANRCVAKHLAHSRLCDSAVLRKHEAPDPKKAEYLAVMMKANLGLDWDPCNAGAIYRSCQAIYRQYGEMLGLCVEMMAMRAGMKQAEYFVYNEEADPHHFALDFDFYTHFTSPIRRYPDVMVHRVLNCLLTFKDEGFQIKEEAEQQALRCNEKKLATRRCSDQLDRAVFCIYLRHMKQWFYTIGTVLAFHPDPRDGGKDTVTVYCSQLGKESKALLQTGRHSPEELGLFTHGDINDYVDLPDGWRFSSRGLLELSWLPKDRDPSRRRKQVLQTLSCVPIVIIPTNTVPIDYALFFVSPFHPKAAVLAREVPAKAAEGFAWKEVIHDARAAPTGPPPPPPEDARRVPALAD